MQFASVRIITDDLDRLIDFYELVTGAVAERPAPVFAELVLPSATLAIGHSDTVPLFGADSAHAADNHSVIIEFQVDDVEAEFERLKPLIDTWVQEPTLLPLDALPRPRWQPRQSVHTSHRGGHRTLREPSSQVGAYDSPVPRGCCPTAGILTRS